jgi:hypothetical protein
MAGKAMSHVREKVISSVDGSAVGDEKSVG